MKRRLIGAALSAGLVFGTGASEARPEIDEPLSAQAEQAITDDFATLRNFWAAKESGMRAVQLEVVTSTEVFNCGDDQLPDLVRSTNFGALEYCRIPNSVVMSEAGINLLSTVSKTEHIPMAHVRQIVVAHELGHAEQNNRGIDLAPFMVTARKWNELEADCLGGIAIHNTFPEAEASASDFYAALDKAMPDPAGHGTAADRLRNFTQGATTGDC